MQSQDLYFPRQNIHQTKARQKLLSVLFLGELFLSLVLSKETLDLSDDLGSALNEVSDLIHGIGLALLADVEKFDVTVLVDNKKADGNDCQTRSTAATAPTSRSVSPPLKATRSSWPMVSAPVSALQ